MPDPSLNVGHTELAAASLGAVGEPAGHLPRSVEEAQSFALKQALELLPIEPGLITAVRLLEQRAIPVVDNARRDRVGRIWPRIFTKLRPSYERIIMFPGLLEKSDARAVTHAVRLALQEHSADSVLLVVTDSEIGPSAASWPEALHTLVISDFDDALSIAERAETVLLILRAVRPCAVLNIDSHAGWELYEQYGRALRTFARLYAVLSSFEYDAMGRADGFAYRYFRGTLPVLNGLYSNNASFIEQIWLYYKPASHFRPTLHTVYQPCLSNGIYHTPNQDSPFRVLWADRRCGRDHLITLASIAQYNREFVLEAYAQMDVSLEQAAGRDWEAMPNLVFHGPFSEIQDLPVSRFHVYLHTNGSEGLSNELVDAAALGMPIIAPDIGAIAELVNPETGWLVLDPNDAGAYVAALRQIRANPAEAARRGENMRMLIAERHSWASYSKAMLSAPAFLSP